MVLYGWDLRVVLYGWDLRYYVLVGLQFYHTGAIITVFPDQLVGMRFWNSFIGYKSNHNTSSSIVIPYLLNIREKEINIHVLNMRDDYYD